MRSGGCWVTRRPDPTDKRGKRVYLTRPAQGLIKRMTLLEVEFNQKVLADMSMEEGAALFNALLKVKHSIVRLSSAES